MQFIFNNRADICIAWLVIIMQNAHEKFARVLGGVAYRIEVSCDTERVNRHERAFFCIIWPLSGLDNGS